MNVAVVICGDPEKIKGDAAINLQVVRNIGLRVEILTPGAADISGRVEELACDADMLVDAILGTGLSGTLRDDYIELIETINAQDKEVLAVDIPSGLHCDSGEAQGASIVADYTVTFVAIKQGFTNPSADGYTGQIFIASIGIEP